MLLVDMLQNLLPNATVIGGFLDLPEQDREDPLAQRKAFTDRLLADGLASLGWPKTPPPRTNGPRKWPPGIVGSVCNKGNLVLAAMAPNTRLIAIGVDVELIGDAKVDPRVVAPEGLPKAPPDVGVMVAFTAKEALYKAALDASNDFGTLSLQWRETSPLSWNARCVRLPGFHVAVQVRNDWVLAAAHLRHGARY